MNMSQVLQLGFQHLDNGNLPMAGQLFEDVLQQDPKNFAALNGRGFVALQQNRLPQSLADFRQSLEINPKQPFAHKMMGLVYGAMGQFNQAMQSFAAALALDCKDPEVYFNRASLQFQAGQVNDALTDLDAAIKLRGSYLEARSNRANLLIQLGDFARAEKDLDYLITKVINNPEIWVALGLAKHKVGKTWESMKCNERALKLVSNHPDALLNSSSATYDQGDYLSALTWSEKAVVSTPNRAAAHYAKAQALLALSRFEDAVESYTKAIELNPTYAEAFIGRGLVKIQLSDLHGALIDYDQAIALSPDSDDALLNKADVLNKMGCSLDSLKCYEQSFKINPLNALAMAGASGILIKLRRWGEARDLLSRAVAIDASINWILGHYIFVLAVVCEWDAIASLSLTIFEKIKSKKRVSSPFPLLSTIANLEMQKKCAEIYSLNKFLKSDLAETIPTRGGKGEKIRLVYLSSDFYNHATSYLMAEMFELHDRSNFEVIGLCYGQSPQDEMRHRVSKSFDKFIEVFGQSDLEIAQMIRKMNVDIAIDLKGHTQNSRLGILSFRVAPVQIHYLGYPGTLGTDFIDYLVADPTLIPEEQQCFYSEKIIYLPYTYQVNDRARKVAPAEDSRIDHGLPENKFVFCCFNNNWKITTEIFDVWMRLLKKVEDSVLWLFEDNELASANLRSEAIRKGVAAERLIFAKKLPADQHLARQRHADLFLDTLYYNAHTTASDALWVGLPMITKIGDTYASRVGASLLGAINLPELIVESIEAYESLAIDLALNPDKMAKIKLKLAKNRLATALFDTPAFTKNLEKAYEAVWSRHQAGLVPDHVRIEI